MTTDQVGSPPVPGTRELILDEAARLFAARGFRGTSLGEIGAAVGISGPAIYRHFAGKEALLGEILVDISRRLLAGNRARRAAADDPRVALESLVDFHVGFVLEHPELITVQDRDFASLSTSDQRTVRRLQRAYVEGWVAELTRVRRGMSPERARAATHAAFGLLNSTPRSAAHASPDTATPVLTAMVVAALGRAQ